MLTNAWRADLLAHGRPGSWAFEGTRHPADRPALFISLAKLASRSRWPWPPALDPRGAAARGANVTAATPYSGDSDPNRGGRLARSEASPSSASGSVKPKNSRAVDVSKIGPAHRNQLLSAYLVQ